MYPLSHGVEVGGTVQLHVLLSPGGRGLECGGGEGRVWRGWSVEGRGERVECRREGREGGVWKGGERGWSVEGRGERVECGREGERRSEGGVCWVCV